MGSAQQTITIEELRALGANPAAVASRTGKEAQRAGATWEHMILAETRPHIEAGELVLLKVPTPLAQERALDNGKWICHLLPSISLDFVGALRGGRAVCIEAKSVPLDEGVHRVSLGLHRLVKPHQWAHARQWAALDVPVFLYVERRSPKPLFVPTERYLFPIAPTGQLATVWHKHCVGEPPDDALMRQSMPWDVAEAWRVGASESWLGAMRRMEET